MKIVTWNCNGALRRKHEWLDALDADVLVIQECEDPAQSTAEYREWARDYVWAGYGKNKGIGIFPRRGQAMVRLPWSDDGYQLFVPVCLDGTTDIVAVWTQQGLDRRFPYIGQFWHYLQRNKPHLGATSIICGDFNSSRIWDRPRRDWNHSDCVRELEKLGLWSLYHLATGEEQGQESNATFFQYRHANKPFHIDYVFANKDQLPYGWKALRVGHPTEWLAHSDHMPLVVDL